MDTLVSGAKELEKQKLERDCEIGDILEKVKTKAEDASNDYHTAKARLENSKKEYQKVKD